MDTSQNEIDPFDQTSTDHVDLTTEQNFNIIQGYFQCFIDNIVGADDDNLIAASFARMMVKAEELNVDGRLILSLISLSVNDNAMTHADVHRLMVALINSDVPIELIGYVGDHLKALIAPGKGGEPSTGMDLS